MSSGQDEDPPPGPRAHVPNCSPRGITARALEPHQLHHLLSGGRHSCVTWRCGWKGRRQQAPTGQVVHSRNRVKGVGRSQDSIQAREAGVWVSGAWTGGHGPAHTPCRAQPPAELPVRSGSSQYDSDVTPHGTSLGLMGAYL